MNLAEESFRELYPEKAESRQFSIKYTRAMKGYNANVRYTSQYITFKLSHVWREVSDDLKKGLIQSLLVKVFKEKRISMHIDMYHSFLKSLSSYAAVTKTDPVLEASFDRMNAHYFSGMMDKPNLYWGAENITKLGHFEYATNTIMISSTLRNEPVLLDYVMYHEMLHKKLKFRATGMRTMHHTAEFRRLERQFHDLHAEEKLKAFLAKKRRRFWF